MFSRTFLSITVFAGFAITVSLCQAWTIGGKGRVNGPSIHTTYFITPDNSSFPVNGQAYVGRFVNGTCQYDAVYTIGTETLRTGDFVDIDAFKLKSVIGLKYTCMTIFYTYQQNVFETFRLGSDGINYVTSIPATSEVTIL